MLEDLPALFKSTNNGQSEGLAGSLAALQTVETVDSRLVEWLKSPLAVGEARSSALKYASRVAGRPLEDVESFVEWVESENLQGIDLESPPAHPFR